MLGKFAAEASINQPRYFSPSFHPSRTASYEIQSAAARSSLQENPAKYSRSRSPLSIREPTPAMIEPGSGFSTVNSRYSSISTLGSQRPSLFLDRDRVKKKKCFYYYYYVELMYCLFSLIPLVPYPIY